MATFITRGAFVAAAVMNGMLALASPATAQNAPENGILVIYGDQKCPTDQNGNEIVVCTRRDADEQYRIPKDLRNLKITPENRSWAKRSDDTLGAGQAGIGSCSTVGPGGATGCFARQARATTQENKARAQEQSGIP
jgi:hypothetical protein